MSAQQRNDFRQIYNQLRLAIVYPGDTVAGVRKTYAPVNKDGWSWSDAMAAADTPAVAQCRRYEKTMWLAIATLADGIGQVA